MQLLAQQWGTHCLLQWVMACVGDSIGDVTGAKVVLAQAALCLPSVRSAAELCSLEKVVLG